MELKYLSDNWQYTDAGLEEAYHIVYYIPSGYRDTTNWTERIKNSSGVVMLKMIN